MDCQVQSVSTFSAKVNVNHTEGWLGESTYWDGSDVWTTVECLISGATP